MQVTLTFPLLDQEITAEVEVTVTSSGRSESPQSLASAGRPAEELEFEIEDITISKINGRSTEPDWQHRNLVQDELLWDLIAQSEDLYTKVFDAYSEG